MWSAMPDVITSHLQVATDQNFNNTVWEVKTQNASATPITTTNPFTDGETYYWHVRVYSGTETGGVWKPWSEIWQAHIDTTRLMTPTVSPPQLLRPTYRRELRRGSEISSTFSYEALDNWPNFEWKPVEGAAQYRIQISDDVEDFSDPVDEAVTMFTNYTPLTKHPWGTYYWRVRAEEGDGQPMDGTLGHWSDTYRLIVERPFQGDPLLVPPDESLVNVDGVNDFNDETLLTSDAAGDTDSSYDLRDLYVGIDANYWYVGFDALTTTEPVRYGVYIDTNHGDNLGALSDPRVTSDTVEAHTPEYAIYWDLNGGTGTITPTRFYSWDEENDEWGWKHLENVGGSAAYSHTTTLTQTGGFVELAIPRGVLYFQGERYAYSLSFMVFSADPDTGQVKDTVPSNDDALLRTFLTDNLAPAPILPPANPVDKADNILHPYTPLFAWHFQENSCGIGEYNLDVARDYDFTNWVNGYQNVAVPNRNMLYSCYNSVFAPPDTFEDNPVYYWRLNTH